MLLAPERSPQDCCGSAYSSHHRVLQILRPMHLAPGSSLSNSVAVAMSICRLFTSCLRVALAFSICFRVSKGTITDWLLWGVICFKHSRNSPQVDDPFRLFLGNSDVCSWNFKGLSFLDSMSPFVYRQLLAFGGSLSRCSQCAPRSVLASLKSSDLRQNSC